MRKESASREVPVGRGWLPGWMVWLSMWRPGRSFP